MQGDCHIYPDIAAYHSIAVTLGQRGRLKELLKVIECMRQKPVKINRNMFRNWDPILEPDVVVYNAVREHFSLVIPYFFILHLHVIISLFTLFADTECLCSISSVEECILGV